MTVSDLPITHDAIAAFAQATFGLHIPPEALPGVRANLAALADHWRRVEADEPPLADR